MRLENAMARQIQLVNKSPGASVSFIHALCEGTCNMTKNCELLKKTFKSEEGQQGGTGFYYRPLRHIHIKTYSHSIVAAI